MKVTALELLNVRGFKGLSEIFFSEKINIFIGANNTGKSTILKSIYLLQKPNILNHQDITLGEEHGNVTLRTSGNHSSIKDLDTSILIHDLGSNGFMPTINIPEEEPHNLIYPYLSKRKTNNYSNIINEKNVNSVLGNFMYLYSKIDRLSTPQYQPGHNQYIEACKNILGFEISTLAKGEGKEAVYFIHNSEHIPLPAMGEGVPNILGLITDLCIAENKIFLIEEPENDIHPKALKELLNFIIEKSITNQFFISTHSNIVMKHLGGAGNSKIFNINNELNEPNKPNLFISKVEEVSKNPETRRKVLEDLGYDFFDFGLWKAWLFLEESSAEYIIRDFLIPFYVPKLKYKLRTFSAHSLSEIPTKFEDFTKLMVFLHLEPLYKNKVWVFVDGGENEKEVISKLKTTYGKSGWDESHFSQFDKHDFESYYPERFQKEVSLVLSEPRKKIRQNKKQELFSKIKKWIKDYPELAKVEFETSAASIIQKLREIEQKIVS